METDEKAPERRFESDFGRSERVQSEGGVRESAGEIGLGSSKLI